MASSNNYFYNFARSRRDCFLTWRGPAGVIA